MAYNVNTVTKLRELKAFAEKVKQDYASKGSVTALEERVDQLVTAGGEPNVITAVKVNGTALPITDKAVDVGVPGYTIEKAADSGEYAAVYQLKKDGVAAGPAINIPKDMVVQSGSVVTNPAGQTDGTYIKLVLQNVAKPLFINVGSLIEYVTSGSAEGDMVFITVDETTHKVTATITDGTITKTKLHADLQAEINGKVDKVTGKGLSSNDYTTEEKNKLAGLENYTHPSHTAKTSGMYKVTVDALGHVSGAAPVAKADITALGIPGQDTTYSPATASSTGLMSKEDKAKLDEITFATPEEVQEMLTEVFGA